MLFTWQGSVLVFYTFKLTIPDAVGQAVGMQQGWKAQMATCWPLTPGRQSDLKVTDRSANSPLLNRSASEVLYSVEAAWIDAREAPLGVEGGSFTPDPVSEPAEPVESILLRACMSSKGL